MKYYSVIERLRDPWRRIQVLAPRLGGMGKAGLYLARAKINKSVVAAATYAGKPFVFRRCDVLGVGEVLHDEEYAFLRSWLLSLPKAPQIIDLGAHIGLFALWVRAIRPDAHILSVEASPSTFAILSRNIALANAGPDWRGVNFAAWRDNETVRFADEGEAMSRHVSLAGGVNILGLSPSTALRLLDSPNGVDLMKIDIEGAEENFLCDDPGALDHVRAVVIELHGKHCNTARVTDLLRHKFPHIDNMQARPDGKPVLFCRKAS